MIEPEGEFQFRSSFSVSPCPIFDPTPFSRSSLACYSEIWDPNSEIPTSKPIKRKWNWPFSEAFCSPYSHELVSYRIFRLKNSIFTCLNILSCDHTVCLLMANHIFTLKILKILKKIVKIPLFDEKTLFLWEIFLKWILSQKRGRNRWRRNRRCRWKCWSCRRRIWYRRIRRRLILWRLWI